MERFAQDLRFALRSLMKSGRFTATALITLVLGIAANIAIFTFVDAALIRPLPYRDASRLYEVYETRHMEVFTQFEASYPDFLDWRAQNQVFDSLAAYQQNQVLLRGKGTPQVVASAVATDNFLRHDRRTARFRPRLPPGRRPGRGPPYRDYQLRLVAKAVCRQA